MEKNLTQMQKEIDNWVQQYEKPYFSPLSLMAALMEEVGEVARVMNIMYGDKPAKECENLINLQEELGDALFSLICIANSSEISLNVAYLQKIEKLNNRDSNRFKKKVNK